MLCLCLWRLVLYFKQSLGSILDFKNFLNPFHSKQKTEFLLSWLLFSLDSLKAFLFSSADDLGWMALTRAYSFWILSVFPWYDFSSWAMTASKILIEFSGKPVPNIWMSGWVEAREKVRSVFSFKFSWNEIFALRHFPVLASSSLSTASGLLEF